MNIKDTYIHEGPGGTNAKALLKDFSITSTLIVLTRAKLTADGSADETDNPIPIPIWNLSTTGNAATASALSVIKSTEATAHYLTFVNSNNNSAANENFYTTENISIVPSEGTLTLTNTIAPALVINNTNTKTTHDCGILFLRSGVIKGWVGYCSDYGMYMYNKARSKYLNYKDDGSLLFEGNKVWHAGNDGPDSGLNADLLDGQHLSDLDTRYILKAGDTITGTITCDSYLVGIKLNSEPSFTDSYRCIPFSSSADNTLVSLVTEDFAYNPSTKKLRINSSDGGIIIGSGNTGFLKANGTIDSNTYLISSTNITNIAWTEKSDDANYPVAFSPNTTPTTSNNGYNSGFTFNPGTKTFNNNGCRQQYDSTNKVLKFIFD